MPDRDQDRERRQRERREIHERLERAEQEEAKRVRERLAREVLPASQGPIGPADVVGDPSAEGEAESDATGVPGVPEERVRKGGVDRAED